MTPMLRRPLDARFRDRVLDGRKFTTIRSKAWPVGVPIMLYSWTGAPYRSEQADVVSVVVSSVWRIEIAHSQDGSMEYICGLGEGWPLYEAEGFDSQGEMDGWFRKVVKRGQAVEKALMVFRLRRPRTMEDPSTRRAKT